MQGPRAPLSRRAFLVAGALFCAAPATAQPAPAYLAAADIDLKALLPPPPAPGSAAEDADLSAALAIQGAASPERIRQAIADDKRTVFDMFGPTLGPGFTAARLPRAAPFLARALATETLLVEPLKAVYARKRPYAISSRVKPLLTAVPSGAYPSGHAAAVTIAAALLATMLPEKAEAIWTRAADYGRSRIITGMHYPTDVEAGRLAGTALAAVMSAKPDYRSAFPAARAELRAAMGF